MAIFAVGLAGQSLPPDHEVSTGEKAAPQYVRSWLAGRVVVEGNRVPPQRVAVTLNCGGLPRTQAYTQPNGHFGFEPSYVDALPSLAPATDEPEGIEPDTDGEQDLRSGVSARSNCRLGAKLSGYTSSQSYVGFLGSDGVTLLSYSKKTSVGEIVLRPLEGLAGNAVSDTMELAPEIALADYEAGMRLLREVHPDGVQAARHLEQALQAFPRFAEAWVALGEARWILGMRAEATQAFTRSINADPQFLPPYEMLIHLMSQDQNWSELEWLTERYLAMSPRTPLALYMSAVAAVNLGNYERAEQRVLELQLTGYYDSWPKSHVILGMVHESRHEYKQAARHYRTYERIGRDLFLRSSVRRTLYEWERLQVIGSRELLKR